jgi:5-methylcytosine-specific restriction endonuclease McrA
VPRRLLEKIAAARDALSHSRPDATTDEILEAALDLLLAKASKAKGLVDRPLKNPRPSNDEDHIPAHVKREVMKRDGGRCQFRLASGEICGCTRHLQFDHVKPLALGGLSTVDNVRLLCRSHNLEAARRVFGDAVMDHYTGPKRKRRRPSYVIPSPLVATSVAAVARSPSTHGRDST